MTRALLLNCVLLATTQSLRAQCPELDTVLPNISKVLLKAVVTQQTKGGIFTYRYTIINSPSNTGCIKWMEMDLAFPQNGMDLPTVGLVDYPNYVSRLGVFEAGTPRIVPVGVPRLPNYKGFTSAWDADFTIEGSIIWGCAIEEYGVAPDNQLDSILLTSYGLPAFRKVILYPRYQPVPVDTIEENEETEQEALAFDSLETTLQWRGFTVGPTAPPAHFSPLAFVDTLNSYLRRSRDLNWIATQLIADKYTGLFARARRDIHQADPKTAIMRLDTVLQQVHIDSSSTLTSEAYAIIRYNSEYIREHLNSVNAQKHN